MEEITLIASAAFFVLGGGVGALINHTYHDYREDQPTYTVSNSVTLDAFASGATIIAGPPPVHVHEAVTQRENGWFCACGDHLHRFVFVTEDRLGKRCHCNEYAPNEAQESRWQSR